MKLREAIKEIWICDYVNCVHEQWHKPDGREKHNYHVKGIDYARCNGTLVPHYLTTKENYTKLQSSNTKLREAIRKCIDIQTTFGTPFEDVLNELDQWCKDSEKLLEGNKDE